MCPSRKTSLAMVLHSLKLLVSVVEGEGIVEFRELSPFVSRGA